jgi:thiol-disulfide isomerase/thioredoxin
MPTIQKLMETLQDDRLEIVMVNTAETEDEVFSFIGIVAPDVVPLMDTDGLVTEVWQPRGLPATFLVDPGGNIRYLALGGREWNTLPYLDFLRRIIAP